ncbi:MAG: hypothetical protein M3Q22_12645, partial [Actinomycetota bacterium]|nr:hypothetical protein [Actinomycetota bacterium]
SPPRLWPARQGLRSAGRRRRPSPKQAATIRALAAAKGLRPPAAGFGVGRETIQAVVRQDRSA